MELLDMAHRGFGEMLGRLDGPLNFRLVVMPLVVSTLAIRAGLRDAREGHASFVRSIVTNPADRRRLGRTALKDVGKIFVVALVLDTAYQIMVLRAFHVVQALIVAVACALVPYLLLRGTTTILARRLFRKPADPENRSGTVEKTPAAAPVPDRAGPRKENPHAD